MNKTPNTAGEALLLEAKHHLPLGVADTYRYWGEKDTVFVKSMQGGSITDTDGKEFVDFRLAYGPIILGYRDTRVDQAVINCITERGTISGFNTDLEAEVVSLIKGMSVSYTHLTLPTKA